MSELKAKINNFPIYLIQNKCDNGVIINQVKIGVIIRNLKTLIELIEWSKAYPEQYCKFTFCQTKADAVEWVKIYDEIKEIINVNNETFSHISIKRQNNI